MKNIKYYYVLAAIAIFSLLLTACGASSIPEDQPIEPIDVKNISLPELKPFLLSRYGGYDNICKNSWPYKAESGEASYAGFEFDSEIVYKDYLENESEPKAMVTYHIFLKSITIENYLVNIPNQTVVYIGGPDEKPSQAFDPSTVLARANKLITNTPDMRVAVFYILHTKYYYENDRPIFDQYWEDRGIHCDLTNSKEYKISK